MDTRSTILLSTTRLESSSRRRVYRTLRAEESELNWAYRNVITVGLDGRLWNHGTTGFGVCENHLQKRGQGVVPRAIARVQAARSFGQNVCSCSFSDEGSHRGRYKPDMWTISGISSGLTVVVGKKILDLLYVTKWLRLSRSSIYADRHEKNDFSRTKKHHWDLVPCR